MDDALRERLEREIQELLDKVRGMPEVPEPMFRLADRLFALTRMALGPLDVGDMPTRPSAPAPKRSMTPMPGPIPGLAQRIDAILEQGKDKPK